MGLVTLVDVVGKNYASLRNIFNVFGEQTAKEIVKLYLVNLQDSLTNIAGMSTGQMDETADIILEKYPRIKITEIHEFSKRIKSGEYKEFYGSLDSRKIMICLKEFMEDVRLVKVELLKRYEKQKRIERDRRYEEDCESGKNMTRDEWLKTLTKDQKIELRLCPHQGCNGRLIEIEHGLYCQKCRWKNFE